MTLNVPCFALQRYKGHFLIALIMGLAFSSLLLHHIAPAFQFPSAAARIGNTPLPLAPVASAAPYDEQVGITFTQDFSTLAFNVSAVAFADSGIGPGYLVNGLTDRGY